MLQFQPVQFKWNPDFNKGFENNPNYNGTQYSLIADDVQKIDPKMVTVETSGKDKGLVKGLADVNHWVALIVQSFKDMETQILNILNKVDVLRIQVDKQQQEIDKQQKQIDKQQQQINLLLKLEGKVK